MVTTLGVGAVDGLSLTEQLQAASGVERVMRR